MFIRIFEHFLDLILNKLNKKSKNDTLDVY